MGEVLADQLSGFAANGREWRTRPLRGIGQAQTVKRLPCFLHDGRTRTLGQPILWHGGQAEKSKQSFRIMSAAAPLSARAAASPACAARRAGETQAWPQRRCLPKKSSVRCQAAAAASGLYSVIGSRFAPTSVSLAKAYIAW